MVGFDNRHLAIIILALICYDMQLSTANKVYKTGYGQTVKNSLDLKTKGIPKIGIPLKMVCHPVNNADYTTLVHKNTNIVRCFNKKCWNITDINGEVEGNSILFSLTNLTYNYTGPYLCKNGPNKSIVIEIAYFNMKKCPRKGNVMRCSWKGPLMYELIDSVNGPRRVEFSRLEKGAMVNILDPQVQDVIIKSGSIDCTNILSKHRINILGCKRIPLNVTTAQQEPKTKIVEKCNGASPYMFLVAIIIQSGAFLGITILCNRRCKGKKENNLTEIYL